MKTFFQAIFTKFEAPKPLLLGPQKYASPKEKYKEYEDMDPGYTPQFLKVYQGLKEDIQKIPRQGPR